MVVVVNVGVVVNIVVVVDFDVGFDDLV